MKNIAILHYTCPPVVGGVEEIVRQQALLFSRFFHPVKIIAGAGGQFSKNIKVEINPILNSQHHEIIRIQKNPEDNFKRIKSISSEIFEFLKKTVENFDILIAHNVLSMHYNLPLTLAVYQLADEGIIKVVGWNHDSPFFYRNHADILEEEPWNILRKYNPAISYITISKSRSEEFQKLYQISEELTVIPNGIDPIGFFRLGAATVRLIRENDLFSSELIMIQPSRLHPRKNIELSIRVLHQLRKSGLDAKLLLTGAYDPHEKKTFPYYRRLVRLATDLDVLNYLVIVAEHKFQSGEKISADSVIMRDLYHISDILFLPSKMEGFGIPLLEAGMIKLPIACSDIPSFRSLAGKNVLYFSLKEDPAEIALKVLNFLNKLETHRMYRKVFKDYIWDTIYQKTLKPFLENL